MYKRQSWASQNVETNNEEDILENINESEIKIESQTLNKDNIVTSEVFKEQVFDSIRAIRLIRAYRVNGHLASNLDPLNLKEIKTILNLIIEIMVSKKMTLIKKFLLTEVLV